MTAPASAANLGQAPVMHAEPSVCASNCVQAAQPWAIADGHLQICSKISGCEKSAIVQTSEAGPVARADPESTLVLIALPPEVAWQLHSTSALLPAATLDFCLSELLAAKGAARCEAKGAFAAGKLDSADVVAIGVDETGSVCCGFTGDPWPLNRRWFTTPRT